MTIPRLACICATYKRTDLLANALACFLAQDYPIQYRRLFILDDAEQFYTQGNEQWQLNTHPAAKRFPHLPAKNHALIQIANGWRPDAYVVFEDDDVFLPWHLSQIASAITEGVGFVRPAYVYSNYALPKDGSFQREGAEGRFHSSWAFTRQLYEKVGGYPQTDRLDFDQQMNGILRDAEPQHLSRQKDDPSYVYRWGGGPYNGSAAGDGIAFKNHWDEIGRRPAPWVGTLIPKMDYETEQLMKIPRGRWGCGTTAV